MPRRWRSARAARRPVAIDWPASPQELFAASGARTSALHVRSPISRGDLTVLASGGDVTSRLGDDAAADRRAARDQRLHERCARSADARALGPAASCPSLVDVGRAPAAAATTSARSRPGDAMGVALLTGDFVLGATGTVTHVDGDRVYGFGHPLYNLGPTEFPMTRAERSVVLPSLLHVQQARQLRRDRRDGAAGPCDGRRGPSGARAAR